MSKRTVKDIEAQIKELEKEKNELEQKELLEKFSPLMDVLSTTTLSIAQIKKAIRDAEREKMDKKTDKAIKRIEKSKTKTVKTTKMVKNDSDKPKERGYKKEHICNVCGKKFMAHSPKQNTCPECKAKTNIKSKTETKA